MKKVILLLMVAILSVNLHADDSVDGDEIKLTKSEKCAMKKPSTRAYGSGVGKLVNMATSKAAGVARAALAESLEAAVIKSLEILDLDRMVFKTTDDDSAMEYEGGQQTNQEVKTICQQVLKGTNIIETDKFFKKANKMYTVYVCVEFSGNAEDMAEDVVKELKSRVSEKDKARINSEFDKLKKGIVDELENKSVNVPDEDEE